MKYQGRWIGEVWEFFHLYTLAKRNMSEVEVSRKFLKGIAQRYLAARVRQTPDEQNGLGCRHEK